MPMIALSPEWWSWQKTTCSWWGIANTLVTVATLLIPFRFLVEPGSEPAYCVHGVAAGSPAMPGEAGKTRCVPYRLVTDSRDDVVTLTTAFRGSGMSRYDSDGLRRVSPHLRAGGGVPRARAVPVGGLRGFIHPAAAARLARGRARRGAAPGHHHPVGRGTGAGE